MRRFPFVAIYLMALLLFGAVAHLPLGERGGNPRDLRSDGIFRNRVPEAFGAGRRFAHLSSGFWVDIGDGKRPPFSHSYEPFHRPFFLRRRLRSWAHAWCGFPHHRTSPRSPISLEGRRSARVELAAFFECGCPAGHGLSVLGAGASHLEGLRVRQLFRLGPFQPHYSHRRTGAGVSLLKIHTSRVKRCTITGFITFGRPQWSIFPGSRPGMR